MRPRHRHQPSHFIQSTLLSCVTLLTCGMLSSCSTRTHDIPPVDNHPTNQIGTSIDNAALIPLIGTWELVAPVFLNDPAWTATPPGRGKKSVSLRITDSAFIMTSDEHERVASYHVESYGPDGIQTLLTPDNPSGPRQRERMRIVILSDGIALCPPEATSGEKWQRTDNKPVGLPPSILAKPARIAGVPPSNAFDVELIHLSRGPCFTLAGASGSQPTSAPGLSMMMLVRPRTSAPNSTKAGDVTWQHISTDTGESLIPHDGPPPLSLSPYSGPSPTRPIMVSASFLAPTKPATRIVRLEGALPVWCETSPGPTITLAPIRDWIGKPHALSATSSVTIESCQGTTLVYRYDRNQTDIGEIVVTAADGTVIRSHEWGIESGNGHTKITRLCADSIPLDGALRIRLIGETAVVQVPFEFTNVPLPE